MTFIPATCELWVDGTRYADGRPGEDPVNPFVMTDLTVSWGRDNTLDQPTPATCTFTIMDPAGGAVRFDQTVKLGSTVTVWAELDGRRAAVFGGRVTDLDSSYDETADAGVCDVIAADLLADLGNRFVGAEPWAAEQMWQRAHRIVTAVGLDPGVVLAYIPVPTPSQVVVSRVDVDRQAAAQLLTDLATSTGAVLWASYNPATGQPLLTFENPASRASLYVLSQDVVSLLWAPAPGSGAGTPLSACEVLRDPVRWSRAVTDLITRVTVRWLDQSTAPAPTERSYALVDAAAEQVYGARAVSVGTVLSTSADAQRLCAGILAGHQPSPSWRTSGLTWDLARAENDDPATLDMVLTLLDNSERLGYAIALTDLPYWTPTGAAVQLYIEGGSYTFETDDDGTSRWVLALNGSPATGLGGSLQYQQTDASIRYQDFDRSVSYLDMIGVGPAGATGPHWADIPTATTWASVPGTVKWSDDPR